MYATEADTTEDLQAIGTMKAKRRFTGRKAASSALWGGVAALEQKYGISDTGDKWDIDQAFDMARNLVVNTCINGLYLHQSRFENSQQSLYEQERVVSAEIEKYYRKAKEILSLNQDFFEKAAASLAQRKLLTMADIQKIKGSCKIVSVAI